ncbi:uncharacterized protein LOC135682847 [Rhopilema esculentum]|uniref:uncharacterized protein LOC135682847 n=1 Tax=Rhopilema esculentum TaxID=499914 RepID=UPI0031E1C015
MESRSPVNFSMLQKHVGRLVSVIGKVKDVNPSGNQINLLMSDGQEVRVALKDTLEELLDGYVQMTAMVESDGSLTAENLISFGNGEIDLNLYNEAVNLATKYNQLFVFTK